MLQQSISCLSVSLMLGQIQEYHCVYVHYQSQDDYRLGVDILRCTDTWHGHTRYDCVIVQPDDTREFARLRHVLRCKLLNTDTVDIALVTSFTATSWKPKTHWDGCVVLNESERPSFIAMHDVVRGAVLCPAFQSSRDSLHYVIDTVDEDMFLRLNDL